MTAGRRVRTMAAAAAVALLTGASAYAQTAAPIAGLRGPAAAVAAVPLREGVAAVVNDDVISTYDLRQRVLLLIVTSGIQPNEQNLPQLQAEALRALTDERLQLQEVRRVEERAKTQLEPTAKEVREQIDRLAQQNGLTGAQLLASLKQAGVEESTIDAQIQAEIAWQRYVGGRFGSTVKIPDDQINATMKRAEAAAAKTQYEVAEIFIDDQRAGGPAQAMEGARQLVSQILAGAPFPNVARQFSSAPSAANGGDAGWMVAGDIQPALEAALEQMRPGQMSQPIAVNGGVYILALRDKKAGAATSLVNLKQVALRLASDASPADVDAAKAKLESLRAEIKSCDTVDAQAAKVQGAVAGDLGEADVNDLAPAFREAIAQLKVGQISEPVRTNAGLHLVALCGKRAGGPGQLTREDVENRLTEQELAMIAKRELRDLHNSASIENR